MDPRDVQDSFSWTANCDAGHFLALGEKSPGIVFLTINGRRIEGETHEIIPRVRDLTKKALDECDFIRFDWPIMSLEYQKFPANRHQNGITLITATGERLFLRSVSYWIHETATDPIISEVDAALSQTELPQTGSWTTAAL
ncbi:hypothetical protein [Streptomyces litmocidini]|uniref:Uncharacterized protein n=1 Tax=Streptomyces litmocidini TaxID=67318 RepID=A0ABW7UB38_9ACTN